MKPDIVGILRKKKILFSQVIQIFLLVSHFCMVFFWQLEAINESKVSNDSVQNEPSSFLPVIRSGDWSDIGSRDYMEDAHVCIFDLAEKFGYHSSGEEVVSFFGVSPSCMFVSVLCIISIVLSLKDTPFLNTKSTRYTKRYASISVFFLMT